MCTEKEASYGASVSQFGRSVLGCLRDTQEDHCYRGMGLVTETCTYGVELEIVSTKAAMEASEGLC